MSLFRKPTGNAWIKEIPFFSLFLSSNNYFYLDKINYLEVTLRMPKIHTMLRHIPKFLTHTGYWGSSENKNFNITSRLEICCDRSILTTYQLVPKYSTTFTTHTYRFLLKFFQYNLVVRMSPSKMSTGAKTVSTVCEPVTIRNVI